MDQGAGAVKIEIQQHPRICFTDIPFELLATHGKRYGKYGVGFRREAIIAWGGLPAWYLPNHWGNDTMKVVGPVLVNGLHAAMDAVNHFLAFAKELSDKGVPISVNYQHGPTITGEQLVRQIEASAHTIFCVVSFIKEMSPSANEDYQYLNEREWRIIAGMTLTDQPNPFRLLTQTEKDLLSDRTPAWRKPRKSADINITARYGSAPLIDSLLFFNGLPGKSTVAQLIDTILVPSETEARWVENFVLEHASLFTSPNPRIEIFPSD